MRTFGTDIDNLIDVNLAYGTNDYKVIWYKNGFPIDITVPKAVMHVRGSNVPIGNVIKSYIEIETDYLDFENGDEIRIDIQEDDSTLTIGKFYVDDFDKKQFSATYISYSSLIDLDKIQLDSWPYDVGSRDGHSLSRFGPGPLEGVNINYIVHHYIDPIGLSFDVEPSCDVLFFIPTTDFSQFTLADLLRTCACIEKCNYILEGNVLHKVSTTSKAVKTYDIDDVVYSENISSKKTKKSIDFMRVKYKDLYYSIPDDPMCTPELIEFTNTFGNGSTGFEINIPITPYDASSLVSYYSNYYNDISGLYFDEYELSMIGDARIEVFDRLIFKNNRLNVDLCVGYLKWEWDGALKCTISSSETTSASSSSGDVSVSQLAAQVQSMSTALKNVQYNSIYASELKARTAELGYASIDELSAEVAKMGYMTAGEADIRYLTSEAAELKYATINSLNALQGKFDTLNAKSVTTDNISAEVAKLGYVTAENLEANIAELGYLKANTADLKYATISSLNVLQGNFDTLNAKAVTTDTISAEVAKLGYVETATLEASVAELGYLKAGTADLKYANIDLTNITMATIGNFFATSGIIKDVVVGEQTITGELVGVTFKGDLIEGNTIVAEKLVIKGNDGLYYKLNTDGVTTEAEQTDYNSLNGSVIRAQSVTADKIAVTDLVAFGATIAGFKITDSALYSGSKASVDNTTRGIYLGKDGQVAFGDANNFIKYYKYTDGSYKLAITAESLTFTTGKSVSDELSKIETTANTAKSTADSANTTATAAQTTANTAKSTADTANTTANSAISAAATAQSTANTAVTNAAAAQSTANTANARATYNYGTCSTAAATAAKVVSCSNFPSLYTGATIWVKFTYANTVASPTLNVNGTGAKAIYAYGSALTASSAYNWVAGATVQFIYNGSQWVIADSAGLSKANTALSTANNAAKTATNFMSYDSTNGLLIGNKSSGSWSGYRTQITSSAFNILNSSGTVLASYGESAVIGQTSSRYINIGSDGLTVYNGSTIIGQIGYGSTIDSSGNTVTRPFSVLGYKSSSASYGAYSVTEGSSALASGEASHAEGGGKASGFYAHAEGVSTNATSHASHAEGCGTTASGIYAHAEGCDTTASNHYSHAEGERTTASNKNSHAEGCYTTASGDASHAGGLYTIAAGSYQTAIGKYNVSDTTSAFIIGNGNANTRSNAMKVDFSGNMTLAGKITASGVVQGSDVKTSSGVSLNTLNSNLSKKQNKIIYSEVKITAPYGNTGYKTSEYNLIGAIEASAGALAVPFAYNGYYYIALATSTFASLSSGTYTVSLYLTQ